MTADAAVAITASVNDTRSAIVDLSVAPAVAKHPAVCHSGPVLRSDKRGSSAMDIVVDS